MGGKSRDGDLVQKDYRKQILRNREKGIRVRFWGFAKGRPGGDGGRPKLR